MRALLVLLIAQLLFGCSDSTTNVEDQTGTLRVGVLPDQSVERLRLRYLPLVDYLEEITN